MDAIIYKNTKTNLPRWAPIHDEQTRGMAYIQDGYLIHLYGKEKPLWTISVSLTASQKYNDNMDLNQWARNTFGAEEILFTKNYIGKSISGVWRPGLYFQDEIFQALSINEHEQRSAEQALRILIEKLDDLFLYIEPSHSGLKTYSHKTRELLILACTEIENIWKQYMIMAGQSPNRGTCNTTDYIKLNKPLFLHEYEIRLKPYNDVVSIKPFSTWNLSKPTQSLEWYASYNKTKHDRNTYFKEATLFNCIQAIAGNIVLFCVRYSPFPLFNGANTLSTLMNQLFEINLLDPDPATFYIPKIVFPENARSQHLVCGDAKKYRQPWICNPLKL